MDHSHCGKLRCFSVNIFLAGQLLIAGGERLSWSQGDIRWWGHAIECRINAEDPKTFMPSPGTVQLWHAPGGPGIRTDSHLYSGYAVPPYYESLIGKLIAHGENRRSAIARMTTALSEIVPGETFETTAEAKQWAETQGKEHGIEW